jgi:hypothetical protein
MNASSMSCGRDYLLAPTAHDLFPRKVKLCGPGPRIYLQKETPPTSAGISVIAVCSISAVRGIPH